MKPFKKILLIILSIPILLLLVSLFLPSKYRVERATVINAKPAAIFARINTPNQWPEWTAWTVAKYPDMKITFSGPESGVGATYAWEGKSSGQGTLKLTRSEPDKLVGYDLEFDHGKYLSKGDFVLEPSGDSVKVTWSNEGDLGWNPVSRYFGLLMDKMMGPDFEEGLRNLRKKAEAK
jgi:hypothetical protein